MYTNFSGLVNSALGKTQKNIGMVFDYARKSPCVLCLDEIDAIGTRRGGKDDVAEMNRVTIALMQELDRLGNDIILVGTTNRPDTLDDALLRRFTFGHTVRPLCRDDARTLARMFFASVGYSASDAEIESLLNDTSQYYTASKITNLCIDHIIDWVANQEDVQAPPIGTEGTVVGVDSIGNLLMHWDNGSGLNVVYGADEVEKI